MRRRLFLPLLATPALAQYEESKGDVPWVPTPDEVMDTLFHLARLTANDTVYDLALNEKIFVLGSAFTPKVTNDRRKSTQAADRASIYDIQPQLWAYEADDHRAAVFLTGAKVGTLDHVSFRTFIARELDVVVARVREGAGFAASLEARKVFPEVAVRMAEVGESTGALQEMLNSVADFFDDEIATSMERFVTLIEPALLVTMGIVIAGLLLGATCAMIAMVPAARERSIHLPLSPELLLMLAGVFVVALLS